MAQTQSLGIILGAVLGVGMGISLGSVMENSAATILLTIGLAVLWAGVFYSATQPKAHDQASE